MTDDCWFFLGVVLLGLRRERQRDRERYIYIYIERERETDRQRECNTRQGMFKNEGNTLTSFQNSVLLEIKKLYKRQVYKLCMRITHLYNYMYNYMYN